jgi:hypothetical protein
LSCQLSQNGPMDPILEKEEEEEEEEDVIRHNILAVFP